LRLLRLKLLKKPPSKSVLAEPKRKLTPLELPLPPVVKPSVLRTERKFKHNKSAKKKHSLDNRTGLRQVGVSALRLLEENLGGYCPGKLRRLRLHHYLQLEESVEGCSLPLGPSLSNRHLLHCIPLLLPPLDLLIANR
jgi:hypothetical protein